MHAASTAPSRLTPEDELHWLALRLVPGLGTRRVVQLMDRFASPQVLFRTPVSDLESAGVPPGPARSIASGCTFDDAVDQQNKLRARGAVLVTYHDPLYPEALREILDPPLTLFVRGDLALLNHPAIAVVGTRKPTPYGMAVAEKLGGDLAAAGLCVISGMARGIDTAAHRAALAVGGKRRRFSGAEWTWFTRRRTGSYMKKFAQRGWRSRNFRWGRPLIHKIFQYEIGSSAG